MASLDSIAPEAREAAARIGEADLVIALPSCHNRESLDAVLVLSSLLPDLKTVLLYPVAASHMPEPESPLHLLPYPLPFVERFREQTVEQTLRVLMQVSRAFNARAGVLFASEISAGTPESLSMLAEPILNQGYDLAIPTHARRKFSGLINTSIVCPMTRALYGVRLAFPMAIDLAVSTKLADLELRPASAKEAACGWITSRAVCAGLQICQVNQDPPPTPSSPDSTDVSAALAQVLNRLFEHLELTAGFWQKVRGSQPVRTFGNPRPFEEETPNVDVHSIIETYQRGCRDLLEIWSPILSPGTLVELRKIARLPVDRFHLGDDVWAHTLYDFVLGHRQRVISREHLLRALTPIYLGWVASYALEVRGATPHQVEVRLESLCASFEKLKPYLLSRWRWPDRFNP